MIGVSERALLALGFALVIGCAGSTAEPTTPDEKPLGPDVVQQSKLPLSFRLHGANASEEAVLAYLGAARAVCIGESHDDPHHHYAQLELTRSLLETRAGRSSAVGFEMFQTPFQRALDAYRVSGNAASLVEQSEFESRWGYGFAYYAPLLEVGRAAGAELLALNAPRELTKAVARGGVDALSSEQRALLPELDLANAEHRAFFESAMGMRFDGETRDSPHGGMSLDDLYAAQVTWDETMAGVGAEWLAHHPDGLLIVIAGSAHCQKTAIPLRIERRGAGPSVAARAIRASELGRSRAPSDGAFDLLVVLHDRSP